MTVSSNKLINGHFTSSTTSWSVWNCAASASSGWARVLMSGTYGMMYQTITTVAGNQLYIACDIVPSTAPTNNYVGTAGGFMWADTTEQQRIDEIVTATTVNEQVRVVDERASGWTEWFVDNIIVVDLTATYGAGAEPSSDECAALYPSYSKAWVHDTAYVKSNKDVSFDAEYTATASSEKSYSVTAYVKSNKDGPIVRGISKTEVAYAKANLNGLSKGLRYDVDLTAYVKSNKDVVFDNTEIDASINLTVTQVLNHFEFAWD